MDKKLFEQLTERVAAILPKAESLQKNVREEVKDKIEEQLKKSLGSLNVISKDEFDAQSEALQRAQVRIEDLEKKINQLEIEIEGK
ncbi:accessory factor UbiK family protein [Gammaproteobacteria bacterium]|nr:accessory factor UbiK family protein [Gammaproteobacteria bacterium]MDB2444751.1 accessory factor UbiK family protein [Gammaproteobacteria bacterium]